MIQQSQLFRVVTVAVIYNNKKEFLLGKRDSNDGHLPGTWATPAGHLEVDGCESDALENNLRREVVEETGVEIEIDGYLDSHSWTTPEYKKLFVVYLAKIKSGVPEAKDETEEVRWFSIEELRKMELPANLLRFTEKAYIIIQNLPGNT